MNTLFDFPKKDIAIVLDKSSSEKDIKSRNSIDKKIEKIDLLKRQIKDLHGQIEIIKNICKEQMIVECEKDYFLNKEKLLCKYYDRYKQSSFSVWQKEILQSCILDQINFLFDNDYQSQRVSEIHQEVSKNINENISDYEKEMFNGMAKEMFSDLGVDIDEEDFDFGNFANPDFMEQFKEKYSEKYSEKHSENQKQEKYEEKEKKVKNTDAYFQKLYRKLVKKAHPDLVLDAKEKERCDIWMKKLSQAWNDRKYYQLLQLQKEIDFDGTIDDTMEVHLDKKQLKPLINQLNDEIKALELNKYILKKEDPDTSYYYANFHAKSKKGILNKINIFKRDILALKAEDDYAFELLKTQKSTKTMLAEIRDQRENSFFDFW